MDCSARESLARKIPFRYPREVVQLSHEGILAKIAVELAQALHLRALHGTRGSATAKRLTEGPGWTVSDVICTSGPQDRPFEERHSGFSIAIVVCGTFQYQGAISSGRARELMTPGSLLLGNAGHAFECGHEHGEGDRCVSFAYSSELFERVAADAGLKGQLAFRTLRIPPLSAFSALAAKAQAGLAGSDINWEELSLQVAARALQVGNDAAQKHRVADFAAEARVTKTVRSIQRRTDESCSLSSLAGEAGLSPYHFLRVFERLTGVTPHQYVLRARLREAAFRLASTRSRILDIALDSGFGDVSNFNRAFRAEFGFSPRRFRQDHEA